MHGSATTCGTPARLYAWTQEEADSFSYAFGLYEAVCGLTFTVADSVEDANMVLWKTELDEAVGRHESRLEPELGLFRSDRGILAIPLSRRRRPAHDHP